MDTPTAVVIDATRFFGEGQRIVWVSLRVGAMLMAAPMIGTQMLPPRVRLILALALSGALAPLLPAMPTPDGLDARALLCVVRELSIGVAIGFVFRLALEAASLAGELVSQGMGLSFAQMLDPLRGAQSPVMGQWFGILAGLFFFAIDGHLALVRVVADSYSVAPLGVDRSIATVPPVVLGFATSMFAAGASIALPVIIAMLVVNIAFGVLARTAPALNPIAIGLPAALLIGFVLLVALLPHLGAPLTAWFESAAATAAGVVR